MKKQIFFSHDWKIDSQGRDNHKRVHEIVKQLQNYGYTTWFDEEDMNGQIDAAMADGIEHADVVIVCITENYCNKINNTSRDLRARDNCLKEWTYAQARNKLIIPIIMEPNMLNINQWPPGVVSMYLGLTLYINAVEDNNPITIISLIKMLEINGIKRDSLPPIKSDKSEKSEKIIYSKNFNISPFLLEKTDPSFDKTSPLSPIKSSHQKISNIYRSKTTNFTFNKLLPTNLTPLNMNLSNSLKPYSKTRVRAKSEVLKSRNFSLNCAYIPSNLFFNRCMPRHLSV